MAHVCTSWTQQEVQYLGCVLIRMHHISLVMTVFIIKYKRSVDKNTTFIEFTKTLKFIYYYNKKNLNSQNLYIT